MDFLKLLLDESKKDETTLMDHGFIKVVNNALFFGDEVIQVSNITRVWIGEVEKNKLPERFGMCMVLGVLSVIIGFAFPYLFLLALIMGVYCGLAYHKFISQKTKYGMQVEMNSGHRFAFFAADKSFLEEIQDTVTKVFLREKNVTRVFNLDNSQTNNIENIENAGVVSTGDNANIQSAEGEKSIGENDY